ncbi:MAG: hypothetical protein HC817_08325 [Saprospiraceae bacterium]|nr:hypothetical protein [Saprospiraceae bacterium]
MSAAEALTALTALTEAAAHQITDIAIPDALIYEMVNGQPIYYRGWREVIKGEKTIEEVMASSLIQSYLVGEIFVAVHKSLRKKYILGTNEAGLKFDKKIGAPPTLLFGQKSQ